MNVNFSGPRAVVVALFHGEADGSGLTVSDRVNKTTNQTKSTILEQLLQAQVSKDKC